MLAREIQLHSLDHFSSLEGGVWAQDLETNEHFSFNARLIIVGTRELSVNYVEVCMYITCMYVGAVQFLLWYNTNGIAILVVPGKIY